jgi:hypothetical protein
MPAEQLLLSASSAACRRQRGHRRRRHRRPWRRPRRRQHRPRPPLHVRRAFTVGPSGREALGTDKAALGGQHVRTCVRAYVRLATYNSTAVLARAVLYHAAHPGMNSSL